MAKHQQSSSAPATPDPTRQPVASPETTAAVHAPPQAPIPGVPDGFVPVPAADLRGYRPMHSEMASVAEALGDLQSFADYTERFGRTAPPAEHVALRLQLAAEWTEFLAQASALYTYAKSQQGVAWKDALHVVERLKVPFRLAAEADPTLAGKYAGLARLLGASRVVGKRAAAARARNMKKNAAEMTAGDPAREASAAPTA